MGQAMLHMNKLFFMVFSSRLWKLFLCIALIVALFSWGEESEGFWKVFSCFLWIFALFLWIDVYLSVQIYRALWRSSFQKTKELAMKKMETGDLLDAVFNGPYLYPVESAIIWLVLVVITVVAFLG
jgi:hypothetical protein